MSPDRLLLVPRNKENKHRLHSQLRDRYPATRGQLSAEGVAIASLDAAVLVEDRTLHLNWTTEAYQVAVNRRRVLPLHSALKAQVDRIITGGASAARDSLGDIPELAVLDDHQWVNVACMVLRDGYGLCVFDEQGAGKTVTTIFAFDLLVERNLADFALIVSPKSMVAEWPNDFARFVPDHYDVRVLTGAFKEKKTILASGADVLVTNFETVVSMEEELTALLAGYKGRAVLVVDESFYAKNLDAKRTLALRRIREWCGRAFVLCGTPAPNSPHDLIQQFNIVDFGITFLGAEIPDDHEGARTLIQKLINEKGLYVRHQKSVVLPNLPSKTFNRVHVGLEPQQARLYESALNNLIVDLNSTDDDAFRKQLASFLARRSALLQICSNPAAVADGYSETPAKILALDQILAEHIDGRGDKVIVWSFYTASIDAIVRRYQRYSPVRYDGTVSDVAERREMVRRFQSDDSTMLFVANPAAAGAGLTLHRSHTAVYESWSNQAAHYLQSLDRIHRRGQTREVEYIVLICENTIEEGEYRRLVEKERAAAILLGDQINPPLTRQGMLDEFMASRNWAVGSK